MTINDFLKVDSLTISRLTDAELKEIATGGRKIANQRIMRLKNAKMTSAPAYQALPSAVKKAGGFKTKDVSRDALISQIQQEQQFIRGKTSTVKGWKSLQTQATKKAEYAAGRKTRYGYDAGGNLVPMHPGQKSVFTTKQVNKYWDVFHKMQQDPLRGASAGSQEIRKAIYDVMIDRDQKRKGVKTLEKLVAARIDELYENDQEKAATADAIRGGQGTKL